MEKQVKVYERLLIRPPRDRYRLADLGPDRFTVGNKACRRLDVDLKNSRGLSLKCSHFVPETFGTDGAKYPCIVYLHGNASSRLAALDLVEFMLHYGITLFCFDFSGSGMSEGDWVTLGGWEQLDVATVLDHLRESEHIARIGLWGRSMGATTSLLAASQQPQAIRCMILDSPFRSIYELATDKINQVKGQFSAPGFIVNAFSRYGLWKLRRSIKKVTGVDIGNVDATVALSKLTMPALFATADADEIVPTTHPIRLAGQYKGGSQLISVIGTHNTLRPLLFWNSVSIFLFNHLFDEDVPCPYPGPLPIVPVPRLVPSAALAIHSTDFDSGSEPAESPKNVAPIAKLAHAGAGNSKPNRSGMQGSLDGANTDDAEDEGSASYLWDSDNIGFLADDDALGTFGTLAAQHQHLSDTAKHGGVKLRRMGANGSGAEGGGGAGGLGSGGIGAHVDDDDDDDEEEEEEDDSDDVDGRHLQSTRQSHAKPTTAATATTSSTTTTSASASQQPPPSAGHVRTNSLGVQFTAGSTPTASSASGAPTSPTLSSESLPDVWNSMPTAKSRGSGTATSATRGGGDGGASDADAQHMLMLHKRTMSEGYTPQSPHDDEEFSTTYFRLYAQSRRSTSSSRLSARQARAQLHRSHQGFSMGPSPQAVRRARRRRRGHRKGHSQGRTRAYMPDARLRAQSNSNLLFLEKMAQLRGSRSASSADAMALAHMRRASFMQRNGSGGLGDASYAYGEPHPFIANGPLDDRVPDRGGIKSQPGSTSSANEAALEEVRRRFEAERDLHITDFETAAHWQGSDPLSSRSDSKAEAGWGSHSSGGGSPRSSTSNSTHHSWRDFREYMEDARRRVHEEDSWTQTAPREIAVTQVEYFVCKRMLVADDAQDSPVATQKQHLQQQQQQQQQPKAAASVDLCDACLSPIVGQAWACCVCPSIYLCDACDSHMRETGERVGTHMPSHNVIAFTIRPDGKKEKRPSEGGAQANSGGGGGGGGGGHGSPAMLLSSSGDEPHSGTTTTTTTTAASSDRRSIDAAGAGDAPVLAATPVPGKKASASSGGDGAARSLRDGPLGDGRDVGSSGSGGGGGGGGSQQHPRQHNKATAPSSAAHGSDGKPTTPTATTATSTSARTSTDHSSATPSATAAAAAAAPTPAPLQRGDPSLPGARAVSTSGESPASPASAGTAAKKGVRDALAGVGDQLGLGLSLLVLGITPDSIVIHKPFTLERLAEFALTSLASFYEAESTIFCIAFKDDSMIALHTAETVALNDAIESRIDRLLLRMRDEGSLDLELEWQDMLERVEDLADAIVDNQVTAGMSLSSIRVETVTRSVHKVVFAASRNMALMAEIDRIVERVLQARLSEEMRGGRRSEGSSGDGSVGSGSGSVGSGGGGRHHTGDGSACSVAAAAAAVTAALDGDHHHNHRHDPQRQRQQSHERQSYEQHHRQHMDVDGIDGDDEDADHRYMGSKQSRE